MIPRCYAQCPCARLTGSPPRPSVDRLLDSATVLDIRGRGHRAPSPLLLRLTSVTSGVKPNVLCGQIFLAGMFLITSACTSGDQSSLEPSGLPTASATLHWATLNLPRGSSCWSSEGRGTCADSAPVDVLLRSGYLKPYRTAGCYRVQIAFHSISAPINSKIELLKAPSGNSAAVKEPAPLVFDLPVIPSKGTGVYVFLVTGTWREGSVSFFLVLDETPGVA